MESLSTDLGRLANEGVYVVLEKYGRFHAQIIGDVIGVSNTLNGAARLVLQFGEFKRLDPAADGDGYDAVPVNAETPGIMSEFQWRNESSRWLMGDGEMVAWLYGDETSFVVQWRPFAAD